MANGTTPRPSELIRQTLRKNPNAGSLTSNLVEYEADGSIRRMSGLGALYIGAGYDVRYGFNKAQADNALFNGCVAWVGGIGSYLPVAEAVADLARHQGWGPEDVAVYLEKNLGF